METRSPGKRSLHPENKWESHGEMNKAKGRLWDSRRYGNLKSMKLTVISSLEKKSETITIQLLLEETEMKSES